MISYTRNIFDNVILKKYKQGSKFSPYTFSRSALRSAYRFANVHAVQYKFT